MTDKQILNLFKDCDFSQMVTYENFEGVIIDNLPDDFEYDYGYGASKVAIIPANENFVIKIPFVGRYFEDEESWFVMANKDLERNWDYCFTEVLRYHTAKTVYHAATILAKPRFIGYVHNHPIYIQQKAETFDDRFGESYYYKMEDSADSNRKQSIVKSTCNSNYIEAFNMKWLTDILDYYGEKQFNIFMRFISTLDDLHDDNVGYIDDRPVIIDFSDWND